MTQLTTYQGITIGELIGRTPEEIELAVARAKEQVARRNAVWARANEVADALALKCFQKEYE